MLCVNARDSNGLAQYFCALLLLRFFLSILETSECVDVYKQHKYSTYSIARETIIIIKMYIFSLRKNQIRICTAKTLYIHTYSYKRTVDHNNIIIAAIGALLEEEATHLLQISGRSLFMHLNLRIKYVQVCDITYSLFFYWQHLSSNGINCVKRLVFIVICVMLLISPSWKHSRTRHTACCYAILPLL